MDEADSPQPPPPRHWGWIAGALWAALPALLLLSAWVHADRRVRGDWMPDMWIGLSAVLRTPRGWLVWTVLGALGALPYVSRPTQPGLLRPLTWGWVCLLSGPSAALGLGLLLRPGPDLVALQFFLLVAPAFVALLLLGQAWASVGWDLLHAPRAEPGLELVRAAVMAGPWAAAAGLVAGFVTFSAGTEVPWRTMLPLPLSVAGGVGLVGLGVGLAMRLHGPPPARLLQRDTDDPFA